MTVKPEDRPIEAIREEVIDQLIMNYSHGIISEQAFERRLDVAMDSSSPNEILALVDDLELKADNQYTTRKQTQFNTNYSSGGKDVEYIVNIFGGSNVSGRWEAAKEIRIFSICGGADIDFSDTVFQSPTTKVKVFCLFGGDEIYVPENINVVSKVFCIFGGVDNQTAPVSGLKGPTIMMEGIVLFGGIDISVKRTIKEKFMSFASQMRNMFNPKDMY